MAVVRGQAFPCLPQPWLGMTGDRDVCTVPGSRPDPDLVVSLQLPEPHSLLWLL